MQELSNWQSRFNKSKANQIKNDGYRSLTDNLKEFFSLTPLPGNLQIYVSSEGQGLEETLILRNAKWHKSCHLKLN